MEVLLNTPYMGELIKKGDIPGIKEALRTSKERGIQNFDAALMRCSRPGASRSRRR